MTFDEWFSFQQYTDEHGDKVFARVAWESGYSEASKELANLRTERDALAEDNAKWQKERDALKEQVQLEILYREKVAARADQAEQERDVLAATVETQNETLKCALNGAAHSYGDAVSPSAILAARDARVKEKALSSEIQVLTEALCLMQKVTGDFASGYRHALEDAIEGAKTRGAAIEKEADRG